VPMGANVGQAGVAGTDPPGYLPCQMGASLPTATAPRSSRHAISALGAVRFTTGVIANTAQNLSFCARAGCRAGPASSVRSSLAVDFVHRPAAAGVHRSRPGIGSASAARRAGAWKGSAKYWPSCVTRSSVIIWASLVAQVARRAPRISQREHCAGGRRAVSGGGSRR
jgi:hypothetical protein